MSKKVPRVAFIKPMLLLRTEKLPEGPEWLIELKLDGYRALAIRSGGKVQLLSRNNNDFSTRYPSIVRALASMPDESVIAAKSSRSIKTAGPPSIACRTMDAQASRCTFLYSIC